MTIREQKVENYTNKIIKLNNDYKIRALKISHKAYLRKYKKLVAEVKKYSNPPMLAERIQDFGAKSMRSKTHSHTYVYVGKNFTIDYCEEECETKWWEACIYDDNTPKEVYDHYFEYNNFMTKMDMLQDLFELDKKMEANKIK